MIENEIIQAVGSLGFPVFAAVWWMSKGSSIIEKNTEAINALCIQVARCPRK